MDPPAPEQVMKDLSHDLMSPYCPGRTIASCPSQAARKLEDHILEQAESGQTREEIEAQLVERFGPEVIGYAGRPIVVWGSVAVGLAAAILLARLGRRWVRAVAPAAAGGPSETGKNAPRDAPQAAELDAVEDALDQIDEF